MSSSNHTSNKKESIDLEKQEAALVATSDATSEVTKNKSSGTDASVLIQDPQPSKGGRSPEAKEDLLKDHTSDTSSTTDRLQGIDNGQELEPVLPPQDHRVRVNGNHREIYIDHSLGTIPIIPATRQLRDNSTVNEAGFDHSTQDPGTKPRSKLCIGLTVLLLVIIVTVAAVMGGLCANGNCRKGDTSQSPSTPFPGATPTLAPTSFRFKPFDSTKELHDAVDIYLREVREAADGNTSDLALTNGYPIGTWDVSRIQDFSFVFALDRDLTYADLEKCSPDTLSSFNEDLSGWDMSNATKLTAMFFCNVAFTGESIANWNVSNVKFLNHTFANANSFNANLGSWDTSQVVTLSATFWATFAFEGNGLANWDTGSVTNMDNTFATASAFVVSNDNVATWNTSSVMYMRGTFLGTRASPDVDLSQWDTSRVEDMGFMFHTTNFTSDISSWNTSMVTDMSYMFQSNKAFDQDLSSWDVQRVQTFEGTFSAASQFTGRNIGAWNTSGCNSMQGTFYDASNFYADLSTWDVSKVTDMNSTFANAGRFNSDLSGWDVSQATRMDFMFVNASSFDSDLSIWNVSRVTNLTAMFAGATRFNSDLSAWDVSTVMDFSFMFLEATSFNQSLCSWAEIVPPMVKVTDFFLLSGCLSQEEPKSDSIFGTNFWTGPWCHPCGEPTFISN
jgi:surface protein